MSEPTPTKSKPSEKKVLIIDDDESVLGLLKTTFDIEGFQVKTAKDGRNLLAKAVEYQPDLIICDLMMPGVGGYDVLRSLQSDSVTRKVPVLIITGSHMNPSTKAIMQQESNLAGYFEKPVRPETLIRNAHKLLNTSNKEEERNRFGNDVPTNFKDLF